jgi:hypothetical protein
VKLRGKRITKEGRREFRWAMVEVAQRAVKPTRTGSGDSPSWKDACTNQAIVAVARHLLTVVWSAIESRQSYRHYSDERIAYKYYTWSWQLDEAQRKGLARRSLCATT